MEPLCIMSGSTRLLLFPMIEGLLGKTTTPVYSHMFRSYQYKMLPAVASRCPPMPSLVLCV